MEHATRNVQGGTAPAADVWGIAACVLNSRPGECLHKSHESTQNQVALIRFVKVRLFVDGEVVVMPANAYVALIRGINVGHAKRVAMAELRALVEDLGCKDVRTLLNSGNVVFAAPGKTAEGAAARIEKGLAEELGVSAKVTVLSAAELAAALRANPLRKVADNPSRLLLGVLRAPADRGKLKPLLEED